MRVPFLLALLLSLHVHGSALPKEGIVSLNPRQKAHGLIKHQGKLTDFEFAPDPVKSVQATLAGLVGSGVGLMAGCTSMGLSSARPEGENALTFLLSGASGAAMTGYFMSQEPAKDQQGRLKQSQAGLKYGMFGGIIVGAFLGIFSGSSDGGGDSSPSSQSSVVDAFDNPNNPNQRQPKLLRIISSISVLHSGFAGAVAGAAVGYLQPEIILIVSDNEQLTEAVAKSMESQKSFFSTDAARKKLRELRTDPSKVFADAKEGFESVKNKIAESKQFQTAIAIGKDLTNTVSQKVSEKLKNSETIQNLKEAGSEIHASLKASSDPFKRFAEGAKALTKETATATLANFDQKNLAEAKKRLGSLISKYSPKTENAPAKYPNTSAPEP